jgi:preprotein translocase subunit SecE
MATEEDMTDKRDLPPHPTEEQEERANELIAPKDGVVAIVHDSDGEGEEGEYDDAPAQLGYKRYVFAGYFAGGIGIAFVVSKTLDLAWTRLSLWKPQFGEPNGELVILLGAIIGTLAAVYYYRKERTRQLAEEVASELSKVTWPSKQEVMNSTAVVIVATLCSTVFFALMDRFWGFLTNLVYGT